MKKVIIVIVAFAVGFFGFKYFFQKSKDTVEIAETVPEDNENWIYLFDGETFSGWHNYGTGEILDQWKIVDGTMVFIPDSEINAGMNNLVTDKEFTNFKLSIDWKISEGGNSGIFWGVHESEEFSVPYQTGPEIQVLDDLNHSDRADKTHRSGALYDMVAPSQNVVKEVGEWNTCVLEINHKTNKGKVWLNNVEIVNFPVNGEGWDEMVSKSKFKDWEGFGIFKTGKIGLQDHGNVVSYKNIKIKEV